MKKIFCKIFIEIVLVVALSYHTVASSIYSDDFVKKILKDNKLSRPEFLKNNFNMFKNLISSKGSYGDISSGWLYFDDSNDKLMIGSSGAVYCGYVMQNEKLKKYGYDMIAFGGIFDDEIVELLKLIKDKKYKKIVVFGGVNDLNLRTLFGMTDIDIIYCVTLNNILDEARRLLIDSQSQIYYIMVKPLIYGVDFNDESFVRRYNNMAKEINDNIELFGYKSYMIPFATTKEYSEHYVHYNNPLVYETMFKSIE
ncbi:MAG: hypothetical protein J6P02_01570 [Lachnospiraceae bacterium]|nr:hypothetical protein [Lachnospiraceae bacterium]